MLKLFDPLEDYLRRQQNVADLPYYASDVMESLGLFENEELENAVDRAIKICSSLNIAVDQNFRKIYRFTGDGLIMDWKISALASYLIIINANPSNPRVAKAQLFFTFKNYTDVKI